MDKKVSWGRRTPLLTFVAAVVVLAFLWLSLGHHLRQKRQDDLAQARRDVSNIAVALAEQVSRLFTGVDQVMRLMQADYRRDPAQFDLAAWVARSTSLAPIAKAVNLFDEHGVLVVSSRPDKRPGSARIDDRAEFIALARGDRGLVVGRTYPGRVSPGMVLPLFRRLEDSAGHFRGVLSVSLDPDYLARQFASLDVGADGSLALFGLDGYVRARTPIVPGMYERDVLELPSRVRVFGELRSRPAGTYRLESAFDMRLRLFGYRAVDGLPLVLSIGRSEAEVLAPFRHETLLIVCFGSIASLAILALFFNMAGDSAHGRTRERALAEAEASFRGLFESSPDALFVHRVAPDGEISIDRFNPAAAKARALDETSRGRKLREILPPHVFENASKDIDWVLATGETLRKRGDASSGLEDREIVIVPLRGANDEIDRVFVNIRDIGHLRVYEAAIAASEARYRLLAETTSDMITRLKLPELTREYVSPVCRSLFGFEPEQMMGLVPIDRIHPEDEPEVIGRVKAFASGDTDQELLTVTYRAWHAAGHWLWVETCMSLARDATGTPEALVCSVRNTDERRRAEAARAASETRFRLLAENTGELIILAHEDGRRSYISPAAERLFGYTADELDREMGAGRWLHPQDAPRLAGLVLEESGDASVSCRVRHKNGAWVSIEAIVRRVVATQEGEPTVIATLRDVTEQRAQAEALMRAKEAAEEASRAKSDFLATMSHEIRTPLTGILGYTDLLLDGTDFDEVQSRYIDRIRNAGSALRTVVDDILDFSKLEAGQIQLRPAAFSPRALVDNAFSIVRSTAQGKGLDLVVAFGSTLPANLIGDHDRLRQVLLNLLNNAIKFTSGGSITLTVNSKAVSESAAKVRFAVADTGIGIARDKLAKLFQRFSQIDTSNSREYGGTGLGLAICKNLIEAMGGTIGVESTAGRGSDFWFEIELPVGARKPAPTPTTIAPPRARALPMPARPTTDVSLFDDLVAEIAPPRAPPIARGLDILLVEDTFLNQELMCALLRAKGHHVDLVCNGAEAIMAVENNGYDLVLMDLQMPYMDGITATRIIRNLATPRRFLPIIALTAAVLDEQTDAALAAGMDGLLTKPVSLPALDATLARYADREARPAIDADIFDEEVADQLERAIGGARFADMRALLATSLCARFMIDLTTENAGPLKAEAHASIAGAAMLGFVRFGKLCRAFMTAEGDATAPAYAALRAELRQVVGVLTTGADTVHRRDAAA